MKSIMISIRPEWVTKILNGEKTIEVRKTAPKDWVDYFSGKTDKKPEPKTVYIYCTKDKNNIAVNYENLLFGNPDNAVRNGKVVAKFTLREVEIFDDFDDELCDRACLDRGKILDYLGTKLGYAWHISDLVIFDRPKELSEFIPPKWDKCGVKDENGLYQCDKCPYGDWANIQCKRKPLTKAPESWCYCEERYPGATMRKIELPKEVEAKPYKKEK